MPVEPWDVLCLYLDGPECTLVFQSRGPAVLGRGEGADFMLPDPQVSRKHIVFLPGCSGWTAYDLSSRTGTLRNGEPAIGIVPVESGDVFMVGSTKLRAELRRMERDMDATAQHHLALPCSARRVG